ncbi:sigma-54 dependent transcriptional regulator [Roseovarius sp. SCSIO 43702]|uniref:response regulator n=1 Tax=Roseovarius sp. SCSIO 43702 TaxID=2823043 RepID=UPI001C738306|nr:response regulator [Roseovarius sp. SCSIO 43702]QYX55495.1 sigma-54 dependent transcriptional regulator [Roseovarius sp. SCSIO 43702]
MDGTVLVADDDRTIRTVLTQALTRAGCKVHATSSLTTLLRWVEEGRGDAVISDVVMPDGNGLEMIPRIAQVRPGLPVIVISAQNTIMTAIRANEAEAFDYLPKPFDLPDLMKRTAAALGTSRGRGTSKDTLPERPDDLPLVGRTPVMQKLYHSVARVLNTELPVLIRGETGTGKTLLARAIHDLSERRGEAFVMLGAADLNDVAVLSSKARGGTILLDGVERFDAEAQHRALRLIEAVEGTRILATLQASDHADLGDDLYFRLAGAIIDMPPLRDRSEDIDALAEHVLRTAGCAARRLEPDATELLRRYGWPGNVRQLENLLRHAALDGRGEMLRRADIEPFLSVQPDAPAGTTAEGETLSDSVARHLGRYFEMHGALLPPAGLYPRILREVELPLIEIALEATGGNQAKCAELLGINRNTLRKKITDLDIRVTRRRKLM